ncbi:MAG: MFS transporter [Sphingomonadaceae bacterium]|uniref:MFS transporter n=1 Tax=Thermaurantiacus sp. TaxID=2820283 RepID=UPI00298ED199|nr:MFS transporter [Thermaurantiacus sp.]MCS6986315.1 MFS transporter [Sphingomonadaceae bacterium]MDW8414423.1 MFS transporter [Thermaurantiacus sp.]
MDATSGPDAAQLVDARRRVGGLYAWWVLAVLVLVYVVNFVDRQIMAILADDIRADLGVGDAEMGFLYGTVFGVFYALFGIPLGRLADGWHRIRLLTIGLALWSAMTALSGFARSFNQLAAARIGVGVGEASASPVAFSVLSDYFPREKRATALAIYSSGLYIGGGLSLFIGGLIVNRWNATFPDGGPLGLVGWQAAFVIVGLPGLLLALVVATLKEPIRGLADGIASPPEPRPFARFFAELSSVLPPLTLLHAARFGRRALAANLWALVVAGLLVALVVRVTGNAPQWIAIGLAGYAIFSWAQSIRRRDPPTFALIWGTPAFLYLVGAFGLISMIGYATAFWQAPYALRVFAADRALAGLFLGGGGALGGFLGVILGGRLSDAFKARHPSGRILIGFVALLGAAPFFIAQFTVTDETVFYVVAFLASVFASTWVGVAAATVQDLVLPRMRGAATATYFLGTTIIGLGLGPFYVGKMSEVLGDLGQAVLSLYVFAPLVILLLVLLFRALPQAEASRVERARAAGEKI